MDLVQGNVNRGSPPRNAGRGSSSPKRASSRSPIENKSYQTPLSTIQQMSGPPKQKNSPLRPANRELGWNEAYLKKEEIDAVREFISTPRNILRKDGKNGMTLQLSINLDGLLHSLDEVWGKEDCDLFGSQVLNLGDITKADDVDIYISIRLGNPDHRSSVTDFIRKQICHYLQNKINEKGEGFARSIGNYPDNYIWKITDINEKGNNFYLVQLGNNRALDKASGDKIDLMFGFDVAEKGIFRVGSGRLSLIPFLEGEINSKGYRVYCLNGTVEQMRNDAKSKELYEGHAFEKRHGLIRYVRYTVNKGYSRDQRLETPFCQRLLEDYKQLDAAVKVNKCLLDISKEAHEKFRANPQGRQAVFIAWSHIIDATDTIDPKIKRDLQQLFQQYTLQQPEKKDKSDELIGTLLEAVKEPGFKRDMIIISMFRLALEWSENDPLPDSYSTIRAKPGSQLAALYRSSVDFDQKFFMLSPFAQDPFETFVNLLVRWNHLDERHAKKRTSYSIAMNWLKKLTQKEDKEECLVEVVRTMMNFIKTSQEDPFIKAVKLRDFYRMVINWNEGIANKLGFKQELMRAVEELKSSFSKRLRMHDEVAPYYFASGVRSYPSEERKRIRQPFAEELVDKLSNMSALESEQFFSRAQSVRSSLSDEGELKQGEVDFAQLEKIGLDEAKFNALCDSLRAKAQVMLKLHDPMADMMATKWMMVHQSLDPNADSAERVLPLLVRMMFSQETKDKRITLLMQIERLIFCGTSPEAQSGREAVAALVRWLNSPASAQTETAAHEAFVEGLLHSGKWVGVQVAYDLLKPLTASTSLPVIQKILAAMAEHEKLQAAALSDFFSLYDAGAFSKDPAMVLTIVRALMKSKAFEAASSDKIIDIAQKNVALLAKKISAKELTQNCLEIVHEMAPTHTSQAYLFFSTACRMNLIAEGSEEFDRAMISIIEGSKVESAMVHFALQKGLLNRNRLIAEKVRAIFCCAENLIGKVPSKKSVQQVEKLIAQCEKNANWSMAALSEFDLASETLYRLAFEMASSSPEKGKERFRAIEKLPALTPKPFALTAKAAEYRTLTCLLIVEADAKTAQNVWPVSDMLAEVESVSFPHNPQWIEKRRSALLKIIRAFKALSMDLKHNPEEAKKIAKAAFDHYQSAVQQHLLSGYFENKEELYLTLYAIICATKDVNFSNDAQNVFEQAEQDRDLKEVSGMLSKMKITKAQFLARLGECEAAASIITELKEQNAITGEQLMALHLAVIKGYAQITLYEAGKGYSDQVKVQLSSRILASAHLLIAKSISDTHVNDGMDKAQDYLKQHSKEIQPFAKASPKLIKIWAKTCYGICQAHLKRAQAQDIHYVYSVIKRVDAELSPNKESALPDIITNSQDEDLLKESSKGELSLAQTPALLGPSYGPADPRGLDAPSHQISKHFKQVSLRHFY